MAKVDQVLIPGTPEVEPAAAGLQRRLNAAVLAVSEAEKALRLARAAERQARLNLARLAGE